MLSTEADPTLRRMLAEIGVTIDAPTADDVERTWAVLREFATIDVTDAGPRAEDGDGFSAEWGQIGEPETSDGATSERNFSLGLTRQFSFSADGDYDHLSQLRCQFDFAVTPELAATGEGVIWSFGVPLDEFFTRVRGQLGFAAVRLHRRPPLRLLIVYGDV